MFWKKKNPESGSLEKAAAHQLYEYLCETIKRDGRIRVEDLITAASSIVGELCIGATGDFDPRKHQFVPGSRVFSEKVNELFSGNVQDLQQIPSSTIVGTLRDSLLAAGYDVADFPSMKHVFEHYAAKIGNKADWGKVPLSISSDNQPFVMPLQVTYETRPVVDRIFQTLNTPQQRLRASVMALAEALIAVREAIDKRIVLTLALEVINGMAKTAPMTAEAMATAIKKQSEGPLNQ